MPVIALRLKNFMAFKDTGWFELSALNLLFGYNSSGKSAIIRALLLLQQSRNISHDREAFTYKREGTDLGNFDTLLHDRSNSRVTFGFRFLLQGGTTEQRKSDPESRASFSLRGGLLDSLSKLEILSGSYDIGVYGSEEFAIDLELTFRNSGTTKSAEICEVCMYFDGDAIIEARVPDPAESNADQGWTLESDWGITEEKDQYGNTIERWPNVVFSSQYSFFPILTDPDKKLEQPPLQERAYLAGLSGQLPVPERPPEGNTKLRSFQTVLAILRQELSQFLEFRYLGPIRPRPHRFLQIAEDWSETDGVNKQNRIGRLLQRASETDLDYIHGWLRRLGFDYQIQINPVSERYGIFSLEVMENIPSSPIVNLNDVGFGFSQILPVLVQSVLDTGTSFIVVEQPELHLHAKAQATLGDFFVQTAISYGAKYILETHSDHLLLRIQRRAAETTAQNVPVHLNVDNLTVNILFVDREKGNSSLHPVSVDDFGGLSEIPIQGFFSTDINEALRLADARIMAKRLQEHENG